MSRQAVTRAMLERAYQVRPRKRAKASDRTVRPPSGPELAYLRSMRGMMRDIRKATAGELATLANSAGRTDAAGDYPLVARTALSGLRATIQQIIEARIEAGLVERAAALLNDWNVGEMQRVLGIDRRALLPGAPLDQWVRANVDLIRSIGSEYASDVERVVSGAADSGMRVEDLSALLEERYGVAESRANLIARDQILKANSDLSEARMRRVGVTRYEWAATSDSRVRPDHWALNGQVFSFDGLPPIVDTKTGRRAHPGRDYQCRCSMIPVFDDE